MSFDYVLSQLVNGIKLGSIYAVIAIGYSMVYGILKLINFAHGDLLTVGVYTMLVLMGFSGMPIWLVIIVGCLVSVVFGVTIERFVYRPLRGSGEETTLISSLAVSVLLQNLISLIFTPQKKAFHLPEFLTQNHKFGPVTLSTMNILTMISIVVILLALTWMLKKTKLGMAMRACSDNLAASQLMGIKINTVVVAAFVIGSGLAALTGLMLAGEYKTIEPLMGFVPGLKAFCAAVLGGIGSLNGAVLGGFIIGIAEMLFAGLMPTEITAYRDAFIFLLLIVVLLVKPNGILGSSEGGRS